MVEQRISAFWYIL